MTGLSVTSQQDFSQGQFQTPTPERIPSGGVYQAINALLDVEQGVIYRRGGAAYKSNADVAGGSPLHIWSGYLRPGLRTVFLRGVAYALDPADDATPVQVGTGVARKSSAAVVDGTLFMGCTNSASLEMWGGATKPLYSTGTVTATQGSATVTGVGTTFTGNVEPGSILATNSDTHYATVKSVDSNTQLTLTSPWPYSTVSGGAYKTWPYFLVDAPGNTNPNLESGNPLYVASVGSPARLLLGMGAVIAFSNAGNAYFVDTNYHRLPQGAIVNGLQSLGNDALVFSSQGLFAIRNMAYDLTDAYGNPQQTLITLSRNFSLWSNLGVAAWEGSLICPAVDDVYLVNASGVQRSMGSAIRTAYLGYVETGDYVPGQAAVHRGHYFLPVVRTVSSTVQTVFVCNLQTGGWTEWSGLSAAAAYVERGGTTPFLLAGATNGRIMNLNGCFSPSSANKNEPDGTTHTFTVTLRDYATGANKSNLVKKARLRFEGTSAAGSPTLSLSVASGPVSAAYTGLSTTDASTVGPSSGTQEVPFSVNRAARFVRFKVSTTDAWDSLKLKGLELFVRPRGRQ